MAAIPYSMTSSRTLSMMLLATLALLVGCDGQAKKALSVSGHVTLNGTPLDEGRITFVSLAEGGNRASADIISGEYSIPTEFGVKPGAQSVQIEAYRKAKGQVQPSALLTEEQIAEGAVEQYLPAKYNTRSELKVEVQPDSDNHFDFKLEK